MTTTTAFAPNLRLFLSKSVRKMELRWAFSSCQLRLFLLLLSLLNKAIGTARDDQIEVREQDVLSYPVIETPLETEHRFVSRALFGHS